VSAKHSPYRVNSVNRHCSLRSVGADLIREQPREKVSLLQTEFVGATQRTFFVRSRDKRYLTPQPLTPSMRISHAQFFREWITDINRKGYSREVILFDDTLKRFITKMRVKIDPRLKHI
jgi:hypothetical protein